MQNRLRLAKKDLREEKLKVKEQSIINRRMISEIKDKHSEIMAIENKIGWVTEIIKKKKNEGVSPAESKKLEQNKSVHMQN